MQIYFYFKIQNTELKHPFLNQIATNMWRIAHDPDIQKTCN